jgi:hypothetical protein
LEHRPRARRRSISTERFSTEHFPTEPPSIEPISFASHAHWRWSIEGAGLGCKQRFPVKTSGIHGVLRHRVVVAPTSSLARPVRAK